MKKRSLQILAAVLILLVITNPTQDDFKKSEYGAGGHRTAYFLFFSVFKKTDLEDLKGDEKVDYYNGRKSVSYLRLGFNHIEYTYIGFFKNFVLAKSKTTFEPAKEKNYYSYP